MIWLYPLALVGLVAVAAPLVIHILVQRRAERLAFPTLRFLRPTRLASIRRHVLDDLALLALRVAIVALAAAAAAGPLLLTQRRRDAWAKRVVTAEVGSTVDLRDGIRRAVATLAAAPPARREIVVSSPFPIGALERADLDVVPADIGIRFIKTSALPPVRTAPLDKLVSTHATLSREITLDGPATSVRDVPSTSPAPRLPIDLAARAADRDAADAALAAVVATRARVPPNDRHARVVVAGASIDVAVDSTAPTPWIAEAIAALMRDPLLHTQAARSPTGFAESAVTTAPWQTVAVAADGRPIVAAASAGSSLVVASAAPATDLLTPVVLRNVADAMAPLPNVSQVEVVSIPDDVLRSWSRAPQLPPSSRLQYVDEDDRRWWWAAVVALLAIETWIRRGRTVAGSDTSRETARVA